MELTDVLARSAATDSFKADVHAFAHDEHAARIDIVGHAPWIKVMRVLAQLLHAEPDLPIERVRIKGSSGCADFVGMLMVETASQSRAFAFTWDCQWRAQIEGMVDYFGFPDQIRAAREFGWQCFSRWEEVSDAPSVVK